MSIKTKAPEVDPETEARREQAEIRAETGRISETQDDLDSQTLSVLRQFGRLPSQSLTSAARQQSGAPAAAFARFLAQSPTSGGISSALISQSLQGALR